MRPKQLDVFNYIAANRIAYTERIAADMGMSESTVRRILDGLARENRITRFHGGAYVDPDISREAGLYTRYAAAPRSKDRIARRAAVIPRDGSRIILLGGTTVAGMCKYLEHKQLTVITNSIPVLEQLRRFPGIRLIVLGGEYNAQEEEMRGSLAIDNLRALSADYLFTGCTAFDAGRGFFTAHVDSIAFYRQCFRCADKLVMLADSDKCGKTDLAAIGGIGDFDLCIVDRDLSGAAVRELEEQGVQVALV